uniref:DUF5123 domain-containing protein n=1 Tax=Mariniflexile sp. TaxID=1979402 RepID=UPI004047D79D
MKTKYIAKGVFTLLLTLIVSSCGYNEAVIEELPIDREFAPTDLTARIRNQTNVELNWVPNENIAYYVVEFSADDPNFNTVFQTEQVTSNELPITVRLEGETLYSIRVKAVSSRGLNDSSWVISQAQTLTEQIMLPSEPGDIQALQATLRWEAGLNVTHFILQPGDIRYDISEQEKEDGVATITGLTSETNYMATLYNNAKIRGTAAFTTGIDVGDNTLVLPTDDLFQMISDAAPGDILLLEQGDYTAQIGRITLDKSITVQGLRVDFKPLLKVSFSIVGGAADVNLIDLDLTGDVATELTDVVRYSGAGNYNSLLVSGCNIHDYDRSLIAGSVTGAIVQSVTVENSVVTNVLTNGGDFIDFRDSDALNITVKTSTFNNCAPARDFFRIDAAGTSNGNATVNVLLEKCTLYAISNNASRRILYIRFNANVITVRNNIFAETLAIYSNQSTTSDPTFSNNNYFNATGLHTANTKYDSSASLTILNPGFVNAATGNFKVTNQTLLDNQVGDPRWRQQ